jgi:starvation-inducible DNA-binding protein
MRYFPTRIDMTLEARAYACERLTVTQASCTDLQSHVKQAHWNVKGADFYSLHTLFDELAAELGAAVDTLAERITALGGMVAGTLRQSVAGSILEEYPDAIEEVEHLVALADRYAALSKHICDTKMELQDDLVTQDIYIELGRMIDKRLWFLEAHLIRRKPPNSNDTTAQE